MPRKALQLNLTTGTIVQTPDLVESSEVATEPTINGIPRADANGTIAAGWIPTTARTVIVEEADGSPSYTVHKLVVGAGDLSLVESGVARIQTAADVSGGGGGGGGTLTVEDGTTTVSNVETIVVGEGDVTDEGDGVARIKTAADVLADPLRQAWTWETIDDFDGTTLDPAWVVAKPAYAVLDVSGGALRLRATTNNSGYDVFLRRPLNESGNFCYVVRSALPPLVNGSNGEGPWIGIGVWSSHNNQATMGYAASFDQWNGRMIYSVTNLSIDWNAQGWWSWHGNAFNMNLMPFVHTDVRVWVGRAGSTYGFGLMTPAGYFATMWSGTLSITPTHFFLGLRHRRTTESFSWITGSNAHDLAVDWVKKLVL